MNQFSEIEFDNFLEEGFFVSQEGKEWLVGWNSRTEASFGKRRLYSPDFFLETKTPWLHFQELRMVKCERLTHLVENSDKNITASTKVEKAWNWEPPKKTEFGKYFSETKKYMKLGELQKVVPVVFESSAQRVSKVKRLQMLKRLLGKKKADVSAYGFWNKQEGMIGLTPETLFAYDYDSKILRAMALAGTRPSSHLTSGLSVSLLEDPKERGEHQFVVDDICKKLEKLGRLKVGTTYEWNVGSLAHLRADIEVHIECDFNFENVVKIMHPTSALGIFSSRLDWKWLKRWDQDAIRNRFGAPFGYDLPNKTAKCLVAIRNIQWSQEKSLIGSGCGLVSESQEYKEWHELFLKRQAVKESLSL